MGEVRLVAEMRGDVLLEFHSWRVGLLCEVGVGAFRLFWVGFFLKSFFGFLVSLREILWSFGWLFVRHRRMHS